MLVLTRKIQEKIQIGDQITVTVLKVKGKSVRVGIDAPRNVRVVRSELPDAPTPDSTAGSSPNHAHEVVDASGGSKAPASRVALGDDPEAERVFSRRYRVSGPIEPSASVLSAIPLTTARG